jgi:hypothetical protein
MKAIVLCLACISLAATGCNSSSAAPAGSSSAKADEKKADNSVANSKSGPTKLPKLGLQIDAPGLVIVDDGVGTNGMMISGPEVGGINISEAGKDDPKTLKAAQSDSELFTPKNVKTETLPDGWVLTFENTGSAGVNYWVTVRREIGKKPIMCTGANDTAAKSAAVVAACKSLKP